MGNTTPTAITSVSELYFFFLVPLALTLLAFHVKQAQFYFAAAATWWLLTYYEWNNFANTTAHWQIGWIAITSVFLVGYVYCYYGGLKHAPVSIVASIMVLGSVITSLLYAIFDKQSYSAGEMGGMLLITVAILVLWYVASKANVQNEALTAVPTKN